MEEPLLIGKKHVAFFPVKDIESWVRQWMGNPWQVHIGLLPHKTLFFLSARNLKLFKQTDYLINIKNVHKDLPSKHSRKLRSFTVLIRFLTQVEHYKGSLYLLGGNEQELQVVFHSLRQTFPHIHIVGRFRGTVDPQLHRQILIAIRKASPSFIFMGTRMGNGNAWYTRYRKELPPAILLWSPQAFLKMAQKSRR